MLTLMMAAFFFGGRVAVCLGRPFSYYFIHEGCIDRPIERVFGLNPFSCLCGRDHSLVYLLLYTEPETGLWRLF